MEFNLETLELLSGAHRSVDDGVCLLEAVAWMAGEVHSDHPACACPVLSAYGRRLNDGLNQGERSLLIRFVPLLLNTRATRAAAQRRAQFFARAACTELLPLYLEQNKSETLRAYASELRTMKDAPFAELRDKYREVCAAAAAYAAYAAADAADAAADADARKRWAKVFERLARKLLTLPVEKIGPNLRKLMNRKNRRDMNG